MKVRKFNENINYNECYLIIEYDNYENYYLFEKEKDACDFIIGMLYNSLREKEDMLKELDNIENNEFILEQGYNLETVAYYYNEMADNFGLNNISADEARLKDRYEFPNWVQLRRNTKKYNL